MMRTFYVVKCNGGSLDLLQFLSEEAIMRLAENDGFIIWDCKGLKLLVPVYIVKSAAAGIRLGQTLTTYGPGVNNAKKHKYIGYDATIRLTPELAEALTGPE